MLFNKPEIKLTITTTRSSGHYRLLETSPDVRSSSYADEESAVWAEDARDLRSKLLCWAKFVRNGHWTYLIRFGQLGKIE